METFHSDSQEYKEKEKTLKASKDRKHINPKGARKPDYNHTLYDHIYMLCLNICIISSSARHGRAVN